MKLTLTRLAVLLVGAALLAAADSSERPKVLGVAHIALFVKDMARTRAFYKDFLGLAEVFHLPQKDGTGERTLFIKVNDQQYFEIFNEKDRGEGQLNHISFYTDDADRMYRYLKSRGVTVLGDKGSVGKDQTLNKNFNVKDPDGHIVEFVEYQPDSWTAREKGKAMPATRISDSIYHLGVIAGDLEASERFYKDILGFTETWRGSSTPEILSWVNLRPAEASSYLELMLYDKLPDPNQRGTRNHASLAVPDAEKAAIELKKRAAAAGYEREIKITIGVNRKRIINLYDPDGTRVELMETQTIDGKPVPSSQAPVPKPAK